MNAEMTKQMELKAVKTYDEDIQEHLGIQKAFKM